MTDRLINLRAWEASALAEGRATALVRVCKPQPPAAETIRKMSGIDYGLINPKQCLTWRVSGPVWAVRDVMGVEPEFRCPFGAPGDVILGREAHAIEHCVEHDQEPPHSDGRPTKRSTDPDECRWLQAHYKATDAPPALTCESEDCAQCRDHDYGPHWRSPVVMPRWAIRAIYTNAGVRCMRVQELTEQDAKDLGAVSRTYRDGRGFEPARIDYKTRFNSDHGPGALAANPWVFIARLAPCAQ